MALYEEEAPWEKKERERREQARQEKLIEEYGPELGTALAESSLGVGAPSDEALAKALLTALTSGSPEQQLKAMQAVLAYAKEAGRSAARSQSRRDNAVY